MRGDLGTLSLVWRAVSGLLASRHARKQRIVDLANCLANSANGLLAMSDDALLHYVRGHPSPFGYATQSDLQDCVRDLRKLGRHFGYFHVLADHWSASFEEARREWGLVSGRSPVGYGYARIGALKTDVAELRHALHFLVDRSDTVRSHLNELNWLLRLGAALARLIPQRP